MKHMKKLFSLLLALVMVMGLAVSASAANTGTITISSAVSGQKYSAYKIFTLESVNTTSQAFSYTVDSDWSDFVTTGAGKDYVKIDDQGYVTWIDGKSAADFAKAALKYVTDNNIDADKTVTASSTTAKFTDMEMGYYLIDSTLGTLCSLDTSTPNVTINEKNEVPTLTKEVQEDSTQEWGKTNDAELGETVQYKATITAKAGAQNYVLHDTMTGLTFVSVSKVTKNGDQIDSSDYTVTSPATDDCSFDVTFDQSFLDTLVDNDVIVVYYSATVNADAVIAGEGNPNNARLAYGDTTNTKYTPYATTTTYVWELPVYKYTKTVSGETEVETPLAGAVFALYTDEACTTPVKLVEKTTNVLYKVDNAKGTVTQITTGSTGKFAIEGLDSGTYYLKEITAPTGYNKLANAIKVVIADDGTFTQDGTPATEVKVLNQAGTELPSTGGMGTTIFYTLGGILVVAAVVLLVTKRRMNAQ